MDSMLPLFLQVVAGGLGANAVAQIAKQINLGTMGNTIAGAAGGLGVSALAGAIPGIEMIKDLGLVGDGITGVVGGSAGVAVFGLAQKFLSENEND